MAAAASPEKIDVAAAIRLADEALRRGRQAEAAARIGDLVALAPQQAEPWLLRARLRQIEGDFPAMLADALQAVTLAPESVTATLICAEAEIMAGETAAARTRLAALELSQKHNAAALRRIAESYTQLAAYAEADRCAQVARALQPDDPGGQFQAASCALAMGRLDEAERLLDGLLARHPDDFDAAYNRATLRRQTPERNHIADLEAARARVGDTKAPPALWYALAKEYEDIGDLETSFDRLERGAAARRRALSYDVATDVAAMTDIAAQFGADFFAQPHEGHADNAPIFVVGLPRSGTTLVDRILSRHPQAESRGELNDLPLAVMRAAGPTRDKRERIARVARADLALLGASYCRSVRGGGATAPTFVDKTPLNFLYLGLIARALPHAKIVHLTRHPMASGYAMLKTLFRMGYPFSYAQEDIARYQIAYLHLMRHWRTHLGDRLLDVSYERLVDNQEHETRRVLAHCGLDWRPECLAFNEATSPTATASAAQVRRPLYRDSLDHWRGLAHRLQPLRDALRAGGAYVA
jgi:tetratricopeptide (TPR) repeat protein